MGGSRWFVHNFSSTKNDSIFTLTPNRRSIHGKRLGPGGLHLRMEKRGKVAGDVGFDNCTDVKVVGVKLALRQIFSEGHVRNRQIYWCNSTCLVNFFGFNVLLTR